MRTTARVPLARPALGGLITLVVCAALLSPRPAMGQVRKSFPQQVGGTGYGAQILDGITTSAKGQGYSIDSLNSLTIGRNSASGALLNFRFNDLATGGSAVASGQGRGTGGGAPTFNYSAPAQKPFAGVNTTGPTVSPYLLLTETPLSSGFDTYNYQTLVRPLTQQQDFNQQLQRQTLELNRRIQTLSARPDFEPQGSEQILPTGHRTLFNNMSHYYQVRQPPARNR